MEFITNIKKNEILDKILKVLLFTYTTFFILYNTIAGYFAYVWIERLECITGLFLTLAMLVKLCILDKEAKIKWLKSSIPVFIYFIIRTASFISTGFQYDVAKTIFFEGVYLLVICGMAISSKFCKEKIMKFFVIVNFAFNILNVAIYYLIINIDANSGLYVAISKYTYFGESGYAFSSMYITPNIFGIMTAFAMIIAFNLISRRDTFIRKVIIGCYMIFSLYCVYLSQCTSVILSLFVVLVCWAVVTLFKRITGRMLVIIAFTFALVATGIIYSFISQNSETGMFNYTDSELEFEETSTGRYSIWKAGYFATEENRLLGVGSLNNEVKFRNEFTYRAYINNKLSADGFVADFRGPNNGYLAMIYCTGILGFLAFMCVLLKKIYEAKSLKSGYWYLAIIYFLSINMFEAMTIVSKLFICLLTFIILVMDNDELCRGE